jgi:hypothetical protein
LRLIDSMATGDMSEAATVARHRAAIEREIAPHPAPISSADRIPSSFILLKLRMKNCELEFGAG